MVSFIVIRSNASSTLKFIQKTRHNVVRWTIFKMENVQEISLIFENYSYNNLMLFWQLFEVLTCFDRTILQEKAKYVFKVFFSVINILGLFKHSWSENALKHVPMNDTEFRFPKTESIPSIIQKIWRQDVEKLDYKLTKAQLNLDFLCKFFFLIF